MFKVGDKVKCVDAGGTSILKEGCEYAVIGVNTTTYLITLDINSFYNTWNSNRFVLVDDVETKRRELIAALNTLTKYSTYFEVYGTLKKVKLNNNGPYTPFQLVAELLIPDKKAEKDIEIENIQAEMRKLEERLNNLKENK